MKQLHSEPRRLFSLLALYAALLVIPAGCAVLTFGWLTASAAVPSARPNLDKTILDQRIESAREIRRALATPLPAPEPLAPLVAKPEHNLAAKVHEIRVTRAPLSRQARDAYAAAELPAPSQPLSQPAIPYDRHTSNY